jgi:hypothetical protein
VYAKRTKSALGSSVGAGVHTQTDLSTKASESTNVRGGEPMNDLTALATALTALLLAAAVFIAVRRHRS